MNTVLQWFNFAGVVLLAMLCAFQWQTAYVRDQHIERLNKTRIEQAAKLDEDSKALDQNQHVLDDLRQQLTASQTAEHDDQGKLTSLTAERNKLSDDLARPSRRWINGWPPSISGMTRLSRLSIGRISS